LPKRGLNNHTLEQ